jgi:hypothetical protein
MIPLDDLFTLLSKESDRGVVVLGFALIEDRLTELCASKLSSGPAKKREELLRSHLDSASARTLLARCAGWLSNDACDVIDCIRKVRNQVAHNPTHGLNDDMIRGHLGNPRWKYTSAVVTLRDKALVLLSLAYASVDEARFNVPVVGDGTALVDAALLSTGSVGGIHWGKTGTASN